MYLWISYKKNMRKNIFFESLKPLKKGVGSGVRFGSLRLSRQKYRVACTQASVSLFVNVHDTNKIL
jgi:hypothetical protein